MKRASIRKYLSIYFSNGLSGTRTKRDLTVAINANDPLYDKCKDMTSEQIKQLIGVSSFQQLVKEAAAENRSLGNYVKYRLTKMLT
jgi:hypothetical protein